MEILMFGIRQRTRSPNVAADVPADPVIKAPLALEWINRAKLKIEYKSLSALKPANRNARTHNKKQIAQIAASIRQFGFSNPVLVDGEGRIVAGHGRVEAAKSIGMADVPTICLDHLNPTERRAYLLADNRLAELAGWDHEILAIELGELATLELDFDLEITGFESADFDRILEGGRSQLDPTERPEDLEPRGPAVSRKGDLWLLGDHRLLCADARDPSSYSDLLNGKKAQMVFTDPPYNVPITGHVGGLGKIRHPDFAMASGEMSPAEFTGFLTKVLGNLAVASTDGSIHYVCMDWRHIEELLSAGNAAYTELKNLCVWNKDNGGMGAFYRSKHELIFVFKNGKAAHINNFGLGEKGRYRTNVWDYAGTNTLRPDRMDELAMHPTVKPVALVADAIKDCSKRGGIVLDAFGGSGTTLLAAERTGRHGYLLELDPAYVDVTIRRWQAKTGGKALNQKLQAAFDELELGRACPDATEA
jgi:DNA modification methylase